MIIFNPFWLFLVVGVALVSIELVVFQFSTFWLLFIGLGALVAASYAWLVSDASYLSTTAVFVVASVAITAILFAPIRRWQNKPSAMPDHDAIGQRVVVDEAISAGQAGMVSWSGTDWQAELADGNTDTLAVGDSAEVVAVRGIRLFVKKL